MTWTYEHPLLYCLPVVVCLIIHIFISAAFIVAEKPGGFRFFLYLVSSLFLLVYILLINHCVTLATTKIEINFPDKYLRYQNQYGALRITAQDLESIVMVEGNREQSTIWIVSRQQTFYIDDNFGRYNEFLPLLGAIIRLPDPLIQGREKRYQFLNQENEDLLNISSGNNILRGHIPYYMPMMIFYTVIAYIWGQKGWQGNIKYFWRLAAVYAIPAFIQALIWPPHISAILILALYPLYPVFLAALCLPKQ